MTHVNLKKATIFGLGAALSFSVMAFFVKLAAPHTNNNMIIFFRFSVSFFYIAIILIFKTLMRDTKFPIKTKHFKLHLVRALTSMAAMLLFYYSLMHINLIDANLLVMTSPLFVPIFAVLLFHEKTNWKSILAIIIAFVGIACVIKPGHELFNPVSLIALSAGIIVAIVILIMRVLSVYDHPHTCMFYYFPLAFLISGIISIFHWQTPDLHTVMLLLLAGVCGTSYQEFLIRASQHAQARVVSTLMYTSVIFSGLLGWQIWGEIPDLLSWAGIALVCCGSIATIFFAKE